MRKKSCAILTNKSGTQEVRLFDKYVSAEAYVRKAKKDGICVEGYACESRYGFVKTVKEAIVSAEKVAKTAPKKHGKKQVEEVTESDFDDIQ